MKRTDRLVSRLAVVTGLATLSLGALPAASAQDAPSVPRSAGVTHRVGTPGFRTLPADGPAKAATTAGPRRRPGRAPASGRERDEQGYAVRKVFGGDDRYPVPDPAAYPWSTVCRIDARFPDGSTVQGSAVLVGDGFALTAGHLVYDDALGGFATDVEVVPGYEGGDAPFGVFEAVDVTSFSGWTRDADYDWDFALLRLDGATADDAGYLGLAAYGDSYLAGQTANTAGYPGDLDDGAFMYGATGEIERVLPGQLLMRGEMDAAAGQSGSGVWIRNDGGRFVVGTISTETTSFNQAARVTDDVYDALVAWMDDATAVDFAVSGLDVTLPREFEAPRSSAAVVTVESRGGVGGTVEVTLLARDVAGGTTVLDREVVTLGGHDEADVVLTAAFPASFAGGTYVLEAEVNGDRAVPETSYGRNVRAGPTFVVLPPYGDLETGIATYETMDAGGVVRYRLDVPEGLRQLRLQVTGPRGTYAAITMPDGRRFITRAGTYGVLRRFPQAGEWLVDVRAPRNLGRPRTVRFKTVPR